ncbi:MAG: penicillin-binding transpeptidase domain-containing protein, partial [Candidatus Limnocylindrales bacterium]
EEGKHRIMTAYLNQIFYGHGAYGVAAAAKVYFGLDSLADLTPAQAAQLAALPKAPTNYDLYQFATTDAEGRLVVDPQSPPVVRRNWILDNLSSSRWTTLTAAEVLAAKKSPVILAGEPREKLLAGHFTWQVRRQLEAMLGGPDALETGGYRVVTTLDWPAQQLAEKWMTAAAIVPNLNAKDGSRLLDSLKIPKGDRAWITALRGKDIHDAALVALDYRTGDVLAYLGSAGYHADSMASPKFDPQFDAAGDGGRQPGSAFKPIVYATAFDQGALTPGSLLLDITTKFDVKQAWAPRDADQMERGPVLVRQALQYSLNIPAIRAYHRVGGEAVADMTERLGIRFKNGRDSLLQAGLAGAIGTVELRPLDLVSAYGSIANGGVSNAPRMILTVSGPDGKPVFTAPKPAGSAAMSPQAAFLVTDILAGNTDPKQNPIWSKVLEIRNGPKGEHRPIAVKTGTANDAKDLATYGFVAPPEDPAAPAVAVGIWMGNSDHTTPKTRKPATSLTGAAPFWRAFVGELTAGQPIAPFQQPDGLVQTTIDAWSGGAPGAWTTQRKKEWFKAGTEPGAKAAVDPPGLLYARACGGWRVDPRKAEDGPAQWGKDVADWLARARRGVGVRGQYDSRTAYFWNRSGWGGRLAGSACAPKPQKDHGNGDQGNGGGHGNGNGNGNGNTPTPSPAPAPEATAQPAPLPAPTNAPAPTAAVAPMPAGRRPRRLRRRSAHPSRAPAGL